MTNPETLNPGWGIAPPAEAVAAWGARAIYSQNRQAHSERYTKRGTKRKRGKVDDFNIDLLWDRKAVVGDDAQAALLCRWLDRRGLKLLSKACNDQFITPDCEEVVTISEGAFTIVASPRMSYGYLYIGAWVTP